MISGFLCERYGLLDLTEELIAENEKLIGELRLCQIYLIKPTGVTTVKDILEYSQHVEQTGVEQEHLSVEWGPARPGWQGV
jgi:hypothetical protein